MWGLPRGWRLIQKGCGGRRTGRPFECLIFCGNRTHVTIWQPLGREQPGQADWHLETSVRRLTVGRKHPGSDPHSPELCSTPSHSLKAEKMGKWPMILEKTKQDQTGAGPLGCCSQSSEPLCHPTSLSWIPWCAFLSVETEVCMQSQWQTSKKCRPVCKLAASALRHPSGRPRSTLCRRCAVARDDD